MTLTRVHATTPLRCSSKCAQKNLEYYFTSQKPLNSWQEEAYFLSLAQGVNFFSTFCLPAAQCFLVINCPTSLKSVHSSGQERALTQKSVTFCLFSFIFQSLEILSFPCYRSIALIFKGMLDIVGETNDGLQYLDSDLFFQ